jgi:hypothetical protein
MSQAAIAGKSGSTGTSRWSDRRIKILATIIVPVLVAVIGLFKFAGGDSEKQTANNFTLITDVTVIENQFQQSTGQPLKDENVKQMIQSAVNLAKAGQDEASRRLFEQVAGSVPVPAVYSNIGALAAEKGDLQGSRQAYQQALAKDPTYKPALQNLQALTRLEDQRAKGHDIDHPTPISIGAKIASTISDGSVADFFQFTTPQGPRDIYQVSWKNGTTTLRPGLGIFDGNRHQIKGDWDCASGEALAHYECLFSADAGATYYLKVWGVSGTTGPYGVVVSPLKRYDAYEPNDDISQAKPIPVGTAVEANIMDGQDKDFYVLKTGGSAGTLTATLENGSTTLLPGLAVFDGNRHQIKGGWDCASQEALARQVCSFPADAGATYYVQVWGVSGTAGAYKLIVK